jgi:GTP cyclohydrolase II
VPVSREPLSLLSVERAVSEIRRGRAVAVRGGGGTGALMLAAEAATEPSLAQMLARARGNVRLALTARRATVLGFGSALARVVVVSAPGSLTASAIEALANPLAPPGRTELEDRLSELRVEAAEPHGVDAAGLMLAKTARLLPAAVIAGLRDEAAADLDAWALRHDLLSVDAGDVFQFLATAARYLKPVADARVPLMGVEDAHMVAFRPQDGGHEHYVVKLGEPQPGAAPLTRLHSACFTGDLLGSLRCDCGDQLRGAIGEIAAAGGGLLLYLAQEGRGIGLVNKLRAYALQDRGFDTLDANEQLGFDADERVYLPAAQMLRALGFTSVRLLTNNPDKVAGLSRAGIAVAERVPHAFPSNRHNEDYLRTKLSRGGHFA